MSYSELLGLVAPELVLTITALVVMAVDLVVMREEPLQNRFWVCGGFALAGCALAFAWMLVVTRHTSSEPSESASILAGLFADDALVRLVKLGLIVLTASTMVISFGSAFTRHVGEYLALILMATVGMMLLVSSTDLLMIFLSLELTSLSLYVLTAFNKQNVNSAEAALKYFLFGGMAAAFTLFGLSFVYGLSGSTNLKQIAINLASSGSVPGALLVVAMVMTVIGFGFKVAVVPFHLWAPDAYQGAPTPSAALIASGSKLAGFFVFARVMMVAFAHSTGSGIIGGHQEARGWFLLIATLAGLSMILGNLAAIVQSDVKRLLAYSAIAHSGYTLLGLLANDGAGVSAIVYYTMTYGLTVIGAFGVVAMVEQGSGTKMSDFAGLSRRAPLLAGCMMVFMLSLAGIPPLAGFFGKFYLFTAALGSHGPNLTWLWLVILAVAMSAVSLYYYLQVLKQIFVAPAPAEQTEIRVAPANQIVLVILAAAVIALGCAPNILVGRLLAAIQAFGV